MVRVCPKRDAVCPHGMNCPYVIDRYECKPEPQMTETPPSIIGLVSNGCGGWRLWSRDDGDKPGEADVSYVPAAALEAAQEHVETLQAIIQWAHDTLYEINPSNYDHDDVCLLNDASVEVILGLAPLLGERHGKSDEWWAAIRALKGGPNE